MLTKEEQVDISSGIVFDGTAEVVLPRKTHLFNTVSISTRSVKGQKRQRFRVIHIIEFIQSNNFHIESIFNVTGLLRM